MLRFFSATLLITVSLFERGDGWGIVDWGNEIADDVENAWNDVMGALSDAVSETTQFFEHFSESPFTTEILGAIQEVVTFTVDTVEDIVEEAVQDFNVTTWEKIVDDAKYVIYNLPDTVSTYISIGCNLLSDLADLGYLPFPLGFVKENDFHGSARCVSEAVFDLAVDWTKEVATTFTEIVGDQVVAGNLDITSFNFTPILNTKLVERELNDTYDCLYEVIQGIKERESSDEDPNIFETAAEFFNYEDLTIAIEISFTACTLSCGTAALGFAVSSTDRSLAKPFYSVAMGLDTSTVVGASVGASLGFYSNFSRVVGGKHAVSFGAGIELPLLPDIEFPDVIIRLSADEGSEGEFSGFSIESDILDFNFGMNGAFSLGYNFEETKWVTTTNDLQILWNATVDIVNDKIDTVEEVVSTVVDAYNVLTEEGVLGAGGYLVKAAENTVTNLVCPSGISEQNQDNTFMGNLSVLSLGAMEIYEVVFGDMVGDNWCNSSAGYQAVADQCQFGSSCSFTANMDTLGQMATDAVCDLASIDLTVIYGCPNQLDVFNLGCYSVNFQDVVNRKWYQDYSSDVLDDGWENRNNGVAKCAKLASENGHPGFAVYNNGMCLMADDLFDQGIYNERGNKTETDKCPMDGLGSDIVMNLYAFASGGIAYDDMGCVNDTMIETYNDEHGGNLYDEIVTLEDEHYLLADAYTERQNAISKCSQLAVEKEYKGFALKDGSECYLSNRFVRSTLNDIRTASKVEMNQTMSCGSEMGESAYMYNAYMFPYIEYEDKEEGLTTGEIVAIVVCPLLFIALLVGGGVWYKRSKRNGKECHCCCGAQEEGSESHGGQSWNKPPPSPQPAYVAM